MKIKYTLPGAHHPTHLDITYLTPAQLETLLTFLRIHNGVEDYKYIHKKA